MIDLTQEVLDLYKNSAIAWDKYHGYYFCNEKSIYLICTWEYLYPASGIVKNKVILKTEEEYTSRWIENKIDQNHPEIVKIKKRLEFLNKL